VAAAKRQCAPRLDRAALCLVQPGISRPTTLILDHFDLTVLDARIEDTLDYLRDLARESADTQKFNTLLLLTS
jgi:hypothetical protein